MSKVEYLTFENSQYFSRSWKMLTRDKGWIKPLLLLTVGALVPVLGALCVLGYGLEWARLTAWGVSSSPKQSNVDLGECLAAGARAFVVSLVWGLLYCVACLVASFAFGIIPGVNVLWGVAQPVVSIFFGVILIVAMLRATVYQRIGAGLEFGEVFKMLKADFGGIARLAGLSAVSSLVVWSIAGVLIAVVLMIVLGGSMGSIAQIVSLTRSGYVSSSDSTLYIPLVMQLISNGIPALVFCGLVTSFFLTAANLILTNACGLWMIQFDVASWGHAQASDTSTSTDPAAPAPVADVPSQDEVVVETLIPTTPDDTTPGDPADTSQDTPASED